MIAHGLAHTLRKLEMKREAEEVAYAWREPLVNNAILFIDLLEGDLTKDRPPFIEPGRVARYAKVTVETGSGEGAQALAWYAYNTCQYPMALEWFQRAVAWLPKEATAYGYALTLQRLKRAKEFRDVVNRYDGLFPRVVALAFDDGRTRPPAPCEASLSSPSAPPRQLETDLPQTPVNWSGRTIAETFGNQPRRRTQRASGRLPVCAGSRALARRNRCARRTRARAARQEDGLPPLQSPSRTRSVFRRCGQSRPRTRRARRCRPRSSPAASRASGPMPYEVYGFTLKPGWNGGSEATSPTAAERPVPLGTLAAAMPEADVLPSRVASPTPSPSSPVADREAAAGPRS